MKRKHTLRVRKNDISKIVEIVGCFTKNVYVNKCGWDEISSNMFDITFKSTKKEWKQILKKLDEDRAIRIIK